MASITQKLSTKSARDAALSNPNIDAMYQDIRAAVARQRAQKAKAKVEGGNLKGF